MGLKNTTKSFVRLNLKVAGAKAVKPKAHQYTCTATHRSNQGASCKKRARRSK